MMLISNVKANHGKSQHVYPSWLWASNMLALVTVKDVYSKAEIAKAPILRKQTDIELIVLPELIKYQHFLQGL